MAAAPAKTATATPLIGTSDSPLGVFAGTGDSGREGGVGLLVGAGAAAGAGSAGPVPSRISRLFNETPEQTIGLRLTRSDHSI
jgi:hypothetical protein